MPSPRAAIRRLVAAAVVASALGGCGAPGNLIVLLDNPDGREGSILIKNAAGERVLDTPGQVTGVFGADTAPIAPIALAPGRIQEVFGATFAAHPKAPATFVLYFRTGATMLTRDSRVTVEDVFDDVRTRNFPVVAVIGHTDRSGSARKNEVLGLRRAQSVADRLVDAGADPKRIEVSSHGETNPLIPTADNVNERRNRRVEITVR